MTAEEAAKEAELNGYKEQFEAAMDDDFNTADAVSAIYELVRFLSTEIKAGASKEFAEKIQDMLITCAVFWALPKWQRKKYPMRMLQRLKH